MYLTIARVFNGSFRMTEITEWLSFLTQKNKKIKLLG